MAETAMQYQESGRIYTKISNLIAARKAELSHAVNTAMIFLYWEIGETICLDVLNSTKADYGNRVVEEVSKRLMQEYGKGFNRSSVFRWSWTKAGSMLRST